MGSANNPNVKLTSQEKSILQGEKGPTAAKAMKLQLGLAKIHGAVDFVEVKSVQVSGVSYHNLGDAGLEFLQEWAEHGHTSVYSATINPAGMDLRHWREQSIPESFAKKQLAVVDAYVSMGLIPACTCTPYLAGNLPGFRESIAWAESSAVTFANSALGARTNREGGPGALAAAITGRTPRWGLHLDEHRQPTIRVDVSRDMKTPYDWGLLGAFIGVHAPGGLPYVRAVKGEHNRDIGCLKALSAALPTFGGSPMFHAENITPEAEAVRIPRKKLTFGEAEYLETSKKLSDSVKRPDFVCLGCPHATLDEIAEAAHLLEGRRVKIPFWICTSRAVYESARSGGFLSRLETSGVNVLCDTCFAVAPLKGRFKSVMTDSAKGCYYGRGHNGLKVLTAPAHICIEKACNPD